MQEIDIIYEQDQFNKNGVILRDDEVVTYWLGPRDQGAANGFPIGAFLENPPDYVPGHVVRKVAGIVAAWPPQAQARIGAERRAERERLQQQQEQAETERRQQKESERRRESIWNLPDPWRGTPARSAKPWWKFW